jgi:hypothetical protein
MAGAPNWVSLFDHFDIILLFPDTGVSRAPFVNRSPEAQATGMNLAL